MAATFTPAPMPFSTDELARVRCALHSGQEPTLEEAKRLMATIDALQTALTWRAGREEHAAAVDRPEMLGVARIEAAGGPAPGQVRAEVQSRHDGRPLNHHVPGQPGGRRA